MPAGSPSIVLYWPQTNYVYVGGGDGKLWQLNFTYNPGDAELREVPGPWATARARSGRRRSTSA